MLKTQPTPISGVIISFPLDHVLLVTLDRPQQLNALTREMHAQLDRLWTWFDEEAWLRCAVVTGSGAGRGFSVGADLKEWHARETTSTPIPPSLSSSDPASLSSAAAAAAASSSSSSKPASSAAADGLLTHGFGGLSNRHGRKPIIAAVHGHCLGGALEMILNADMVLATETARFGLPEVGVGVVAVAGGLPRLARIAGRQRASEMALLGETGYTAWEMCDWGVVNRVVGRDGLLHTSTNSSMIRHHDAESQKKKKEKKKKKDKKKKEAVKVTKEEAEKEAKAVLKEALSWASRIAANSPDAVLASREALLGGWEAENPRDSTRRVGEGVYARVVEGGENMREGIASFVERRRPRWRDSKL